MNPHIQSLVSIGFNFTFDEINQSRERNIIFYKNNIFCDPYPLSSFTTDDVLSNYKSLERDFKLNSILDGNKK